jgi:hypothetical protein
MGEVGRSYYRGDGPALDFISVPQYVIDAGLCFKWYTLYMIFNLMMTVTSKHVMGST